MKNIYLSSIVFKSQSLENIITKCISNVWSLEFSSNIPYQKDLIEVYSNAPIKKIIHNYFPAAKIPYVLNLASSNDEIRNKSINHCIKGIQLAKISSESFFSIHAGFCVDPKVSELGNIIKNKNDFNINFHLNLFIDSLNQILPFCDKYNIDLLIENNVITKRNIINNTNPLLFCISDQILKVFQLINKPRLGILLDTAHLYVSCNTMAKNIYEELENILPYVRAVHHSENDGKIDNNLILTKSYWAIEYIKHFNHMPNIIEVANLNDTEISNQIKLLESWM